MKKLIISIFLLLMGISVWANPSKIINSEIKKIDIFGTKLFKKAVLTNPNRIINTAVLKADISRTALIGVDFKEIDTKKTVVNHNANTPMSVASVQKVVTTIPALNKLGKKYEFKTQLYKTNDKKAYLKLGADPYLTSRTLKYMIKDLKEDSLNAFYIDDTITDRIEWGEGWQWDNTLNTFMPKFGAYNIDSNLISIVIRPTSMDAPAEIFPSVFYPIVFENKAVTGTANNIKFTSQDYMKPDFIEVSGTINQNTEKTIPINDLRKYFILRVKDSLKNDKISYYGKFDRAKVPTGAKLVSESKTSVEKIVYNILQNSNNMMSETLFKVAGGGTEEKAIKMFKDYYQSQGINIDGIKITDASGVSKNNLLTADFITNVLVNDYEKENSIKKYMATPGVGTLQNRMFYFKDKLIAKTGTLQNVSAIAGYLTAENGKTYAFCIIINDPKSTDSEKKAFEEYVLRKAYEAL